MAAAATMSPYEGLRGYDQTDYDALIKIASRFDVVGDEFEWRKTYIKMIMVGMAVSGVTAVFGGLVTFGALGVVGGATLAGLIVLLAKVAKGILDNRELRKFEKEWRDAQRQLRKYTTRFVAPLQRRKDLENWARANLNRDAADAVICMLSKSDSHAQGSTERLQQLTDEQLRIVFDSLINIILADLDTFELVTGIMAIKGQDPASRIRDLGVEIRKWAERGRRERKNQEREREEKWKRELKEEEEKRRRELKEQEKRRRELKEQEEKWKREWMKQESDSCELTSDESIESISINATRPVFSEDWQGTFTLQSTETSTCQLQHSDVMLIVPTGAVPIETTEVHAAVCTDVDYIHGFLQLEEEEEIVSPLVEYKTTEFFRFQKLVSIILPLFLPEDYDSNAIYVYHVSTKEDQTFETRKLSLIPTTDLPEKMNAASDDKQSHFQLKSADQLIIRTESFSGFFACMKCGKEDKRRPELNAAISDRVETHEKVIVKLRVWDRRLKIRDFRKETGIDMERDTLGPVDLLPTVRDTALRICLLTEQGETLIADNDGNNLTDREKIFPLPHELMCKKCLRRGRFRVMAVNWLLCTSSADPAVSVCVHHCEKQECSAITPTEQQPIVTKIPLVIKREASSGENVIPVVPQQLEERNLRHHERGPQGEGISQRGRDFPATAGTVAALEGEAPGHRESCSLLSAPLPPPVDCEQDIASVGQRAPEATFNIHCHDEASGPDALGSQPVAGARQHQRAPEYIAPECRMDNLGHKKI